VCPPPERGKNALGCGSSGHGDFTPPGVMHLNEIEEVSQAIQAKFGIKSKTVNIFLYNISKLKILIILIAF